MPARASLGLTYAVFGATNGTVTLGGKTAKFNSSVNTNALGSFLFKVTDNTGFSYTNVVNVHIISTNNTPPTLAAISSQTINVGANLFITNSATDVDVPAQILIYSLPTGPTNATIISTNGILSWRPLVTQASSTNLFAAVVTDNGTPNLSATQSFCVTVNPLATPTFSAPTLTGGWIGFSINGQTGSDYAVQVSSNLMIWSTQFITNSPAMPFT